MSRSRIDRELAYWNALVASAFFIGRSWLKSRARRAALGTHKVVLAREQEGVRKRAAHRQAAELAAHHLRWNAEAVFARRLRMDKAFVQDGTVGVDVTARETTAGPFAGVIITSGGKGLWRCRHHHSRQRRRGDRSSSARHEFGSGL